MIRYSKYFLQNALWLDDGFCQYHVQDDFWGLQEILDVETLVFFWPEDACQWLRQCAEHDHGGTLHRLRDYLADYSLRPYVLHRMDDAQVMRAAAEELTENMSRVVIQPYVGWAVQLDKETRTPELPPKVEPEPELTHMLSELKEQLDALVAEQKEKSARFEAQLANLTPEQRALFYSKKAGTGVFDSAVGDTWDMIKAAPSVLWSAAKAFPGFYAGYLKSMWKIAQTPSKMASLTAHGIATGDYTPLKQEIDKIVIPVTTTYEQAVKYKSMLTVLFGNEQVYALLHDFATRYYEATHPAELTEMAASAVADIVVTVILAIVTAGVGAAANVASKSGRLVKVAKLLEKIASTLRRIGPKSRFLDKAHDAASTAAKVEKKAAKAARKKAVPDIDSPKPAKKLDKKASKGYDGPEKSSGPDKKAAKDKSSQAEKAKTSENIDQRKIDDNSETNTERIGGEPVDTVTGEVVSQRHDFTLPGRLPLSWTAYYGSHKGYNGTCGFNWQCPADARLVVDEDKNVIFYDGSPNAAIFETLPDDRPIMEAANGAVLDRVDGRLTVRQKSGLTYSFADPSTSFKQLPLERITDANGNYLEFIRSIGGLAEIADNNGSVAKVLSRNGRIMQIDAVTADGALAPMTKYEYNASGELVAVIDALGNAHRFEYTDGLLTKTTNRNGLWFCYDYDDQSPPRCVRSYGPNGLFDYSFVYHTNETHCIDALGNTTVMQYDENNLLTAMQDKDGHKTHWSYDKACRITSVTDSVGKKTAYKYDQAGNLISVIRPDNNTIGIAYDNQNNPVAITDARSKTWKQQFNAVGLMEKQITPTGTVTRYEYNPQGDLIAVIDPKGGRTQFKINEIGELIGVIDPLGNKTKINVDKFGNVTSVIDSAGEKTTYQYDAKHRLIKIVRPSKTIVQCGYDNEDNLILYQDEAGHRTKLEYWGFNKVAKRHNPDGTTISYQYDNDQNLVGVTNEKGETLQFVYDHQDRIVEEIDYWGNRRQYTYDPAGTLLESIDPLGRTTRYSFDPLNQLIAKTFDDGRTETFAYDENGNMVEHANEHTTAKRTYDDENRLISETTGDITITNAYDLSGNRIKRTTSHGNQVDYDYDLMDNVTGIAINGQSPIKIDRNSRGQAVKEVLTGQIQRRYDYDEQGYLTGQKILSGSTEIKRSYEYDPTGNLIARKDSVKGDSYFSYDPCGRITQYINPEGQTKQLLHDKAGDLLRHRSQEASELRTMTYEDAVYQFDAAGNLVHRKDKDSDIHFNWDSNNRLIHAESTDGTTARMAYDAQGRRIAKHTNRGTTTFAWDGDCILSDQKTGKGPREFVFYPGTFEPIAAIDADKSIYYFHNDHIGAPQEVTDDQGEIVWSASYNATGGIEKLFVNTFDNPIRLQGQYADDELGLYYNLHRCFDPRIGAFISQDPLGIAAGVNLYAYAPNVWGWVDPLGLMKKAADTCMQPAPKKGGEWVESSKHADDIIGNVKQKVRKSLKGAAGKGKHQGGHGKWKSEAAKELDKIAKQMENKGDLTETVDRIKTAAERLRQSAKGTNHGM